MFLECLFACILWTLLNALFCLWHSSPIEPSLYAYARYVFEAEVGSVDNVCVWMRQLTCVLKGLRQPLLSDSWHTACLISGRGADSGQTAQCTHMPLSHQHSMKITLHLPHYKPTRFIFYKLCFFPPLSSLQYDMFGLIWAIFIRP